ncbi:bola-like protein [Laetiporus sulphureus 93-53]|uniref:Bola-like protein n=1 Tax=Laetiporus sulphureus 93-53 TaxID=1314785 RepID=A0A165DNK8_9APHY|nr:bola-like protein [Laetiporus sulphureus 93-53]KZT05277.1 bola-like protein [Laetiporus sulphureus 93-53]
MPISQVELENAIRAAIPIIHLEIHDQSNGCGENYAVFVVSPAFEGKNTLARHRFINQVLRDQIARMHAFSQKTLTPKQYETQLIQP